MGNPFQEESAALLVLDTKSIADSALVELFGTHHEPGKQFKSFKEDNAISIRMKYLNAVTPCSHEEADTRVFVHPMDATLDGKRSINIKANDTDVVVIAVSTLPSLQELYLESMWIAFGHGANARCIPVHEVVAAIGPEKVSGILFFHAFTSCDVVSGFHGKGKKSAWLIWDVCNDVSETFIKLSHCPREVSDDDLHKLENFVVLMYDRSSAPRGVNEARLDFLMPFLQPELP